MKGMLGKKLGMTRIFTDDGEQVPVTVIEAGPCQVTQLKTAARDGYSAVQMGYGEAKPKNVPMPLKGHFEKAGVSPKRTLCEFEVEDPEAYELGQEVKVDIFKDVARVDVSGVSKGKGFAGAIKRHNFSRGPSSHGSHYHRAPGSLGASATPSRVFKGRKLPGRMGGERVTVQSLDVVRVDEERNLLLVKGPVPGPKGSFVEIREAVRG